MCDLKKLDITQHPRFERFQDLYWRYERELSGRAKPLTAAEVREYEEIEAQILPIVIKRLEVIRDAYAAVEAAANSPGWNATERQYLAAEAIVLHIAPLVKGGIIHSKEEARTRLLQMMITAKIYDEDGMLLSDDV